MSRKRNYAAEYAAGRILLLVALGMECVECGCRNVDKLQFDHVYGRTWVARKCSRWQRLANYRREAARGEIVLRCKRCNQCRGKPFGSAPLFTTSTEDLPS